MVTLEMWPYPNRTEVESIDEFLRKKDEARGLMEGGTSMKWTVHVEMEGQNGDKDSYSEYADYKDLQPRK